MHHRKNGLETYKPLTCMRFLINILIVCILSKSLLAQDVDWDTLEKLIHSQEIQEYSAGYTELKKLVDHSIDKGADNSRLREMLYGLLDDERPGGKLSSDEYLWTPKVLSNSLLIKLTKYAEGAEFDPNRKDLLPVDESFQIASDKRRRANFRLWYEQEFLGLKFDRKTNDSRKYDSAEGFQQQEFTRRSNQKNQSQEEVKESKKSPSRLPWIIAGVILLGILALLIWFWR